MKRLRPILFLLASLATAHPVEALVISPRAAIRTGPRPDTNVDIVEIEENDGLPLCFDPGDPTQALWQFDIKNNSNILPPAHPYNERMSEVRLYNIYSESAPSLVNPPVFWAWSITEGADRLWEICFGTNRDSRQIQPGDSRDFEIVTYRPSTLPDFVIGTRYGQGLFQSAGYQPAGPMLNPGKGDPFLGPVGEMRSASLTQELMLTNAGIFGPHVGPTFTPDKPLYMTTVPKPASALPLFAAALILLRRRSAAGRKPVTASYRY